MLASVFNFGSFSQSAFTCLNLTVETLEEGVKYVQNMLTIKATEQRQWRRSGVFIVNFEQISHLILVFLLLTLSRKFRLGKVSPFPSVAYLFKVNNANAIGMCEIWSELTKSNKKLIGSK